jgi:hypothetical protein
MPTLTQTFAPQNTTLSVSTILDYITAYAAAFGITIGQDEGLAKLTDAQCQTFVNTHYDGGNDAYCRACEDLIKDMGYKLFDYV